MFGEVLVLCRDRLFHAVVRVSPHSTSPTLVAGGLSFPNGFAADADGALYVSNWSVAPANSGGGPTGEVVRITP
jgi:sugar lactone lactonase YvrE